MSIGFVDKFCLSSVKYYNNMIDLKAGKAVIAVYPDVLCDHKCIDEKYHCTFFHQDNVCISCKDCIFAQYDRYDCCHEFACAPADRDDGKKVIYKIVDYVPKSQENSH